MKILGEKKSWLVILLLAILSIIAEQYSIYLVFILYILAVGYSIYSLQTNNELSIIRRIFKGIFTFIIATLLFSFVYEKGFEILRVDSDMVASCNSIETKELLDKLLKDGAFKDSEKYRVESTDFIEFNKNEKSYSCKGILKADLENNKLFKENNAYVQEAMKGLAEKVRINIEYKIMNANIKDGFKVEITNHQIQIIK